MVGTPEIETANMI